MLLLLDAYDSFSHNLAHLLKRAGAKELRITRCDKLSVEDVLALEPSGVCLSPGPGRPGDRGIFLSLLQTLQHRPALPVLGVCLGHQAIIEACGGSLTHAPRPVHGEPHRIRHDSRGLFEGLPESLNVMRYHSLIADPREFPPDLEVCATLESEAQVIMGVRHRRLPWHGIQFHPESFLSEHGVAMIRNFLERL